MILKWKWTVTGSIVLSTVTRHLNTLRIDILKCDKHAFDNDITRQVLSDSLKLLSLFFEILCDELLTFFSIPES